MKRRNVEIPTAFSNIIKQCLNMQELQGISFLNENTSMAIEAIDLMDEDAKNYLNEITREEITAKTWFADQLGVPFHLALHQKRDDGDRIYLLEFTVNSEDYSLKPNKRESRLSEEEFVNWWSERCPKKQLKGYRPNMKEILGKSYFDILLDKHGLSWAGNIDGFLLSNHGSGTEIAALIENRYSNKLELRNYDPNNYYRNGGGDYKTWTTLKFISDRLNIPLILFTYSRTDGNENIVGIAEVINVSSSGLTYKNNIPPCKNLLNDTTEVCRWIENNVEKY